MIDPHSAVSQVALQLSVATPPLHSIVETPALGNTQWWVHGRAKVRFFYACGQPTLCDTLHPIVEKFYLSKPQLRVANLCTIVANTVTLRVLLNGIFFVIHLNADPNAILY